MKPLASLLFVAVITLGVSSRCPPQWTFYQGNCYRYGDKAVSWHDAQLVCQTRGAKLAEVSSQQENNFLTSMARQKRASCVWLGADDIFHEGTWEWASSSNTFSGFTNWASGEPNNFGGAQDCLNLLSDRNYAWDDRSCGAWCNFICSTGHQMFFSKSARCPRFTFKQKEPNVG